MRIECPFCGERDSGEFVYRGDATVVRPDNDDLDAFFDYVYLRDNPAGLHAEHWYHRFGCRSWLIVQRDTRTHQIHAVSFASELGS